MLSSADDRLDEVEGLLAQRSATGAPQVPTTLDEFTQQAQQGSALMLDSYNQTKDPGTVAAVRKFAADGLAALQTMADTAPASTEGQLREAALQFGETALQVLGALAGRRLRIVAHADDRRRSAAGGRHDAAPTEAGGADADCAS